MRTRAALRTLAILGSGLSVYLRVIHPWQLRWGATDDEVRRTMPGDELVARPTFNATRAVTVAAPPSLIWPWIVQIGFGKAGWYSYDLLDNFGRPSARHIIPEFQQLQVGDLVPMYQGIGAPEGVGDEGEGHRARAVDSVVGRQNPRHDVDLGAVPGR